MKNFAFLFVLSVFLIGGVYAQNQQVKSVYTSLKTENCKTVKSNPDEGGSYQGLCAGTGGYKLELLEGDLRQTINVVAPGGKKHELKLWTVVSSGFSSLGENAEWRVFGNNKNNTPTALIVRFNASDNPEDSSKNTSYLVVAKITKNAICVTDVVRPQSNANEQARALADASADKPCKSEPN